MSKKMMKRTAALSALIAVALSGTVFAAEYDMANAPLKDIAQTTENITITGENIVVSADSSVDAIFIKDTTPLNLTLTVGNDDTKSITVNGGNDSGIYIRGYNATYGVTANITAQDSIVIGGENTEAALWVQGQVDGTSPTNVTVKADTVKLIGKSALYAFSGAEVMVEGSEVILKGSGDEGAIQTRGQAKTNISGDTVKIDGDVVFCYNQQTSGSGANADLTIDLKGEGSYWNGDSRIKVETISGGYGQDATVSLGANGEMVGTDSNAGTGVQTSTNFNVKDFTLNISGGATWTTKGNSFVNTLNVDDGNIVMEGTNQKVIVANFEGDDATITTNSLDNKFEAGQSTAENTTVKGGAAITAQLEDMTDAQAQSLYTELLGTVSNNVAVTQLAFEEAGLLGEGTVAVTANGFGKLITKENKANAGLIDMTALSFMAWRGENDDLNERLGDLRNANGERGIWTRMSRAQQSYNTVTNQYNMYQIGYDQQAGDWTLGAAYSYTDGKSWFEKGTGENTHNVFSLYGTKMNNNGSFIDVVAKYGNLDYEYTLAGGVGDGDYDTDAYSFSAEVGKRITTSTGAWVEPQLQLTYGTVDDVAFATKNGYNVNMDSADSFVARAGIMAGKPVYKGNIYLKASYLYDFAGEVEGTFSNGTRSVDISRDLGGGWWEVGAGANFNLSDATHLYLDFEKAIAGEAEVEWKWNAGIRYSF